MLFLSEVKLIAASDGMGGRKQSKQASAGDMPAGFSKARAKAAMAEHKMVEAAFDTDGCFENYKLRKLSLCPGMYWSSACLRVPQLKVHLCADVTHSSSFVLNDV